MVAKISFLPKPTKDGRKKQTQMYIADPESPGTFGREDYQFSIFGNPEWIFPPMEVNSILRIHHMIAEEYDNNPTFR